MTRSELCCSAGLAGVLVMLAWTIPLSAAGPDLPQPGGVLRDSLPAVDLVVMPRVEVDELEAEDAEHERRSLPIAPRFAKAIPAAFNPQNSGTWEILDDGSAKWRLRISSPGALSLNLGLERFDLAPGAAFWIYDPSGAQVQGPYTAKNRNNAGGLWTAVVLGDELVAELHLPADAAADLEIASVNHGYRFFGESDARRHEKRGSCNINVVCPEGDPWRNQIRSVARFTISGAYVCTGQLINNTAQDNTPYFLTAQHCVEVPNQASTLVFYWNFESPGCDDAAGGSLSQNQSGSAWIASSPLGGSGSDFTLVELDQDPDPAWNLYLVGWDAREQAPASTTTIHHPSGDEKSISFDADPPTITNYLQISSTPGGTHLRIADWDEGTTEGGSSGSCLYDDASKLCVGTLSGGYAACGNDLADWYGRTAKHWVGGGTDGTRLSTWLDPGNTGVLAFPGRPLLETLFDDGFESGSTSQWSATAPAP